MQRWAKHFKCVEPHVSVILVSLGVHRPYILGLICRSHASTNNYYICITYSIIIITLA